tara:strand:- start:3502 stop:3876 length:375 start_codon:yes stop_codon:yes gene_type:complete
MISPKISLTILSLTALALVIPNHSYAKKQSCTDFEKHFKELATLEKTFSTLKRQKSGMEGSSSLIKEAGTDLLDLRVPLVALDPQKERSNHLAKCQSASEKFIQDLPDAQKSLAELKAFGPMLG